MFPALSHLVIARFSNFEIDFVAPATNVVSKLFLWLVLNRLRKTCLAL